MDTDCSQSLKSWAFLSRCITPVFSPSRSVPVVNLAPISQTYTTAPFKTSLYVLSGYFFASDPGNYAFFLSATNSHNGTISANEAAVFLDGAGPVLYGSGATAANVSVAQPGYHNIIFAAQFTSNRSLIAYSFHVSGGLASDIRFARSGSGVCAGLLCLRIVAELCHRLFCV